MMIAFLAENQIATKRYEICAMLTIKTSKTCFTGTSWNWSRAETSCSYAKYQRLAIKNHSTRGTVIPRIFFACFAHFGTITNNGLMQGTDDLIIHKNDLA